MVLQKQIKLSDYYVKKHGNTISQDGNNVTAATKNVATDGSGNIIFEEKNSHNHGNINDSGALSGKDKNVVTDSNGVITTEDKPTIPTKISDLTDDSDFLTNSAAQSTYVAKEDGKGLFSGSYNALTDKPTLSSFSGSGTFLQISDIAGLSNQLDASFKVEVIRDYTVEYLDDNYHSVDGDSFGQLIDDKSMNYDANTIYLLPNQSDFPSFYNEYILISDSDLGYPLFELLGTTQIDLSDYISKQYDSSDILLANGTTIAQSSFISKGEIQVALSQKVNTSDLIDLVYPIGSIYMSVNSTSPATLFGGTWEQLQNRFLLGAGSSYTNGATGGASTVSLTSSQMPRHTHIQDAHTHIQDAHTHIQDAHNHSQNAHSHRLNNSAIIYNGSASGQIPNGNAKKYTTNSGNNVGTDNATASNNATIATNQSAVATNQDYTATNKYTGGTGTSQSASNGSAHENMPPYLVVYMWKRTA